MSRAKQYIATGDELPLPEPGPAAYLLEFIGEVGLSREGMGGPVPIGFQELQAWRDLARIGVTPWEIQTMRLFSVKYCDGYYNGKSVGSFAPWDGREVGEEPEVGAKLKEAMETIKRPKRGRRPRAR